MYAKPTDPNEDLRSFFRIFQRIGLLALHPSETMTRLAKLGDTNKRIKREIVIPTLQLIMFMNEMIRETNFVEVDDTWTRGMLNFFFNQLASGKREAALSYFPMGFLFWDFNDLATINTNIGPENADEYMGSTNRIIHRCIWPRAKNIPWQQRFDRRREHRRLPQTKARTKSGDEKCAFIPHASPELLEQIKQRIYQVLSSPEAEFSTTNRAGEQVAFPPNVTVTCDLFTDPTQSLKSFLEFLERQNDIEKNSRRPTPERKKQAIKDIRLVPKKSRSGLAA